MSGGGSSDGIRVFVEPAETRLRARNGHPASDEETSPEGAHTHRPRKPQGGEDTKQRSARRNASGGHEMTLTPREISGQRCAPPPPPPAGTRCSIGRTA